MNISTLKKLANDKPLWDSFIEYLDSKIHNAHIRMEQSKDVESIYKMQGEIAAMRRLKLLREEVNGTK